MNYLPKEIETLCISLRQRFDAAKDHQEMLDISALAIKLELPVSFIDELQADAEFEINKCVQKN